MTESNYYCRHAINSLVLTGFFVNQIMQAIFPIAIVDMIATNESTNASSIENFGQNVVRFNWTQNQKHSIIGIFIWGQILAELAIGRMAELYGPRKIIECSVLINSLLTILLRFAFQVNYQFAYFFRFFMGLIGPHLRICIEMVAVRWFPPSERSKFMGKTITASIGEAFSLLCAGYIISYLGWPSLFYICGFICFLWTLLWFYFIYDTPEQHPRISIKEKQDIMKRMKNEANYFGRKRKLPLKQIFTNKHVLALFATFVFSGFSYYSFVNYIPTFVSSVLHFNIRQNGILSCLHYIGQFFCGMTACYIANAFIKSKKMSVTTVRKICTGIGQIGSGLLILSLMLWGNSRSYCIFVFITSFSLKSLAFGGHVINSIDLAPNFAATLSSICFIIGALSGWVATKVMSATVSVDNTFESWKLMFIILGLSIILSGLVFVLFASGEIQPFNNIIEEESADNINYDTGEMETLKVNNN